MRYHLRLYQLGSRGAIPQIIKIWGNIIYHRYDFNVANIMINVTAYSLKGDVKFRS
jgi:hypothetical protein